MSKGCCTYPFLGTSTLKDNRESDGFGEEPRIRDGRLEDLRTGWGCQNRKREGFEIEVFGAAKIKHSWVVKWIKNLEVRTWKHKGMDLKFWVILAQGHLGYGRGEGTELCNNNGVLREMTFWLWETQDVKEVCMGQEVLRGAALSKRHWD